MGDAHPDRADSNGVDRASTDRLLNACEKMDGAVSRVNADAARGLAALIQTTEFKTGDRDYAKERALIDAKALLHGLAVEDVECLGMGRVTARALRLASRKVGVRIIDCEYLDDVNVAEMLSDLLAAGRLLLEAQQ